MVNRRRLRSTIRPVMIHDELPVNRSNEPIENSSGIVRILGKRGRACCRAIPEHEKAGRTLHRAKHSPIGLPRLGEFSPDDVGPSVGVRLRNRASPAFQLSDQVRRQFRECLRLEPMDRIRPLGRLTEGLCAYREWQNAEDRGGECSQGKRGDVRFHLSPSLTSRTIPAYHRRIIEESGGSHYRFSVDFRKPL
jgi:hypothetical protein